MTASSPLSRTRQHGSGWWRGWISAAPCRYTRWPIAGTSCCAAAAPRCSRTGCRGIDAMSIDIYLPETPSQTAGPYVHIGLIPRQAGFDIFENNLGAVLAGPEVQGQRIRIEGRIF